MSCYQMATAGGNELINERIFHTDIRSATASAGKFVLISFFIISFVVRIVFGVFVRCEEFDSLTIFKDQRST